MVSKWTNLIGLFFSPIIFGAIVSKPSAPPTKSPFAKVYNATIANGYVTFTGSAMPVKLSYGMKSSSIQVFF